VLIPFTHGGVVARIHELGTVLKEDYTTEGTLIDVRLPHSVATELQDFIVETS
jgi:GTP-binding protein hflX